MTHLSVVFHSGFGHTKVLAEQVKAGAEQVAGVRASLLPVEEIESRWTELESADAIAFGSPTYMGSVSGPFKTFMDASSKPWLERKWKDKLAAGFTVSGSPSGDKLNTLQTLMIFAMQHGMLWIGNAELPYNEEGLNRLGSFSGVMGQAGQVPPDVEPNEADRKAAAALGRRLAEAAVRWGQGA
ncbi:flavodoxin family protein [Geothrix sp. 21YS21S-4]|uniref:flavodoxin family protein n=1 Tax=Geothrix sp. 21YS21S-4 TaxID=3068889 RepID=UPI0027B97647|nr:flavodoxin family protein [Geothrix sp. 21YS21S-4]